MFMGSPDYWGFRIAKVDLHGLRISVRGHEEVASFNDMRDHSGYFPPIKRTIATCEQAGWRPTMDAICRHEQI